MFASRSTLSHALSALSFVRRTPSVVGRVLTAIGFCSLAACGAGIHALYEGDVRFEHCMALEDTPDVKVTIRTACWDEWLKFYTFGQTSDRIEYAKVRLRKLRVGDDASTADELASESHRTDAVPEPTSALAPPPMMLVVDAGPAVPEKKDDEQVKPPGAACSGRCETAWLKCKKECVTPMCNRQSCIDKCEQSCTEDHATCMRFCFM